MMFRSAYDEVKDRVGDIDFSGEPVITKQEFKEESDVNTIMSKYVNYGVIPEGMPGAFADVSDVGDFLDAQLLVKDAVEAFEALPSRVRERFGNDPARLLEFLFSA